MGGVDVGDGGGGKRATNTDINMVPFIDLLLVTIAFLLITAVWVTNSRINADAQVPGPPDPSKELSRQTPEKVLQPPHLRERVWPRVEGRLHGGERGEAPEDARRARLGRDATVRYPDLAKKLQTDWEAQGGHRDPSDKKVDQCVLHTDNKAPFKEIVAVLDALYTPRREMKFPDGTSKVVPVFNMTFSVR
jgi:biopolymer transport protein ExbD